MRACSCLSDENYRDDDDDADENDDYDKSTRREVDVNEL